MTRILAAFGDLKHAVYGDEPEGQLPHQQLLTPQYMEGLGAALKRLFPNDDVEALPSGMVHMKGQVTPNIRYSHVLSIVPTSSLMFDVRMNGEIHGQVHLAEVLFRPFLVTKTVFPDDNPSELAAWIQTETTSKVRQAEAEMVKKYGNP